MSLRKRLTRALTAPITAVTNPVQALTRGVLPSIPGALDRVAGGVIGQIGGPVGSVIGGVLGARGIASMFRTPQLPGVEQPNAPPGQQGEKPLDLVQLRRRAMRAAMADNTMLTGATGIDSSQLNIGKALLLGGFSMLGR